MAAVPFTTGWNLKTFDPGWDYREKLRDNKDDPSEYQRRVHHRLVRYRFSNEGFQSEEGTVKPSTQLDSALGPNMVNLQPIGPNFATISWLCMDNSITEVQQAADFYLETQTWEHIGDYVDFDNSVLNPV